MHPLLAEDVLDRLRSYPHHNYLYLGSILKGVALYFACLVGLEILHAAVTRREYARIIPWIASFAAMNVSYMKWGRGVILTAAPANLQDAILPLCMGLAEFSLFALLSPRLFLPTSLTAPTSTRTWSPAAWFAALAAHNFSAVLLVWNRVRQTSPTKDYAKDLQPLAEKYISWMKADMSAAAITGLVALGIGLVVSWRARAQRLHPGLVQIPALASAVFLFCIAAQANRERRVIEGDDAIIRAGAERVHEAAIAP